MLGLFAHPDDEVFCVGGTIACAAAAGAETTIVSLTRGDAGQIRDSAVATRRTLGATRVGELEAAAAALGVDVRSASISATATWRGCRTPTLVDHVHEILQRHTPDVVVTFGDDGGFGHPDHISSSRAVLSARTHLAHPPRVLHARSPAHDRLLLDLLVDWLTSEERQSVGASGFGSQYALDAELLPRQVLGPLLSTEYSTVVT